MSLDDKEFELAVEKAIDEVFASAERKVDPSKPIEEDESLKTHLALEPLDQEPAAEPAAEELKLELEPSAEPSPGPAFEVSDAEPETKAVEFPQVEDLLEEAASPTLSPVEEAPAATAPPAGTAGLSEKDLERLSSAILSLEWDISPENCLNFLALLEEIRGAVDERVHEILDLMQEVGTWLRDRPGEARPEWFHFLNQGLVTLNLVAVHGKSPETYLARLREALDRMREKPAAVPDKLLQDLLEQVANDYQRFVLLEWLFSRAPKLKGWRNLCQKALKEIEFLVAEVPRELRPDLRELAEAARRRLKGLVARGAAPRKEPAAKPVPVPFTEAYLFRVGSREWILPAEEVAYRGPFREKWRKKMDGRFPLKLLLGFWAYFSFVKLRSRLSGELARKEEKELRALRLPVLRDSPEGEKILVLWKDGRGGVVICDQAEFVELPLESRMIPGEPPVVVFDGQKVPLFKWP